jgi:hypothetical protein
LDETISLSLCPGEVFTLKPLRFGKLSHDLRAALRGGEMTFYGLFCPSLPEGTDRVFLTLPVSKMGRQGAESIQSWGDGVFSY